MKNNFAGEIISGAYLPEIVLNNDAGELITTPKGDIEYKTWTTKGLTGKVRTIYHLAARLGIDKKNENYINALKAEHLPKEKYQTVIILNIDDAPLFGSGFARSGFEKNKKNNNNLDQFVLDDESRIRKAWGLEEKSSTVIILGKDGKVLQFKDGPLSDKEIFEFVKAIKSNL